MGAEGGGYFSCFSDSSSPALLEKKKNYFKYQIQHSPFPQINTSQPLWGEESHIQRSQHPARLRLHGQAGAGCRPGGHNRGRSDPIPATAPAPNGPWGGGDKGGRLSRSRADPDPLPRATKWASPGGNGARRPWALSPPGPARRPRPPQPPGASLTPPGPT